IGHSVAQASRPVEARPKKWRKSKYSEGFSPRFSYESFGRANAWHKRASDLPLNNHERRHPPCCLHQNTNKYERETNMKKVTNKASLYLRTSALVLTTALCGLTAKGKDVPF